MVFLLGQEVGNIPSCCKIKDQMGEGWSDWFAL
jgi:hypothetical protein